MNLWREPEAKEYKPTKVPLIAQGTFIDDVYITSPWGPMNVYEYVAHNNHIASVISKVLVDNALGKELSKEHVAELVELIEWRME